MDFNLYFRSRRSDILNLLKGLVNLESPTADKKAVEACSALAVQELRRAGAKITPLPQKEIGQLHVAEFSPPGVERPDEPILVLTHIDTVWPVGKLEKMPFYVSGDKVFGPGVLDMKAGLVMAVFALSTLHRLNLKPRRKVRLLINSAEETGNEAAHGIIRQEAKSAALVLCLEPALPGGALKLERKGRLVMRLETRGKAAHAGTPEKGVNAIEELTAHLARLKKLRARETTMNIGLIGGGEKPNIVAESAWAALDIRFWTTADKERIRRTFKDLGPVMRGAKVKSALQSITPPLEKTRATLALFNRAKEIAAGLGIGLKSGKAGGGSDASVAASVGVPALDGLGPDGDGIHAEHEHLLISSLVQRTALLTELLLKL
ncbi:MAG: M20 family metallopeptidase [Candidatus Aminicenantes bacterium]|nr:M20 family metallopeptidase [Candidatus Aminicenantes bacterium]